MTMLLIAAGILAPVSVLTQHVQVFRAPAADLAFKIGMGCGAPLACGYFGIQSLRHSLWLFGVGPYVEPFFDPPMRINCVMMALASVFFPLIAIENGSVLAITCAILAGLFMLSMSVSGFLWAKSEASKSCQR
jgi:F0F1-type ATP synthase membrane subunit a